VDDTRELFLEIALEDVRRAAELLRPIYDATGGHDGFVSFEVTPDLADDTQGTITQARELWRRLDAPNVMIKVPATEAGVPAIEQLTADGVNVNVTLLFSVERYELVMEAYLRGLERRAEAGEALDGITSVASFFVSRVDAKAYPLLPPDSRLRGAVAIANAQRAYGRYLERFAGKRWDALCARGARRQRPLWASTGAKDPAHSDVLYVERLIAPAVINTMPEKTLLAFADHGIVGPALDADPRDTERVLAQTAEAGVDLDEITTTLEREGVRLFCSSYTQLLDCIGSKLPALAGSELSHPSSNGSPADSDAVVKTILESLDSAGGPIARGVVRWLHEAELPFSAGSVLITLDSQETPMSRAEIAEASGISIEAVVLGLHELHERGYASANGRRYQRTAEGERVLASLARARQAALATFVATLSEPQRRDLAAALHGPA
jgi:transaldolase